MARVAVVLGAVDGSVDVLLRDGVDVVVEMDGEDARLRGLRVHERCRRERSESERDDEKSPQEGV